MTGRRSILGVAVLLALALSAFAASNASGANITGFTCVTDPTETFLGDHCLKTGSGSKSKHVEIPQGEPTTGIATNANTASETTASRATFLHGTLAGTNVEITCTEVTSEGGISKTEKTRAAKCTPTRKEKSTTWAAKCSNRQKKGAK